ncbi:MAG TPA: hypothetical protein VMW12_10750 [Candidatus Dormibacteraeota bacterium]|nr:hypothetical protein [Candidatus Dormibacteraeota bacterium]
MASTVLSMMAQICWSLAISGCELVMVPFAIIFSIASSRYSRLWWIRPQANPPPSL